MLPRSLLLSTLCATLVALSSALGGCGPSPAMTPIAEVTVPTAPPAPPGEATAKVAVDDEDAPRKARPAGDLRTIILRIVHTERRKEDAEKLQKRLTDMGATVRLYPTSDDLNEPHVGHLYVKKSAEKLAPIIVRAVSDVEEEEVVHEEGLEGDHNAVLWVVR
ncbi:MAG: hypothetical protein U0359_22985 [Byssovorax sp.]